jgi:carbonic anhydrase/acetyltransferase-like protein (isoleucine patch superfamily)
VFVAPTASVIGDVSLGAGSSVWYGAKVRGDVHTIKIGANSSIGDCSMV